MVQESSMMFGHLSIAFDSEVLRPRAWTVTQSIWAAELLRQAKGPARVLELCAGAGQIGFLCLALGLPTPHRLVAVDRSASACEFARRNAATTGLWDRVEVRKGAMDEVLNAGEEFELVIADPPWVERAKVPLYPDDPPSAIDGGLDGLDLARRCIGIAEKHLAEGGSLLLQLGTQDQADRIRAELQERHTSLAAVDVWLEPTAGALMHIRSEAGGSSWLTRGGRAG